MTNSTDQNTTTEKKTSPEEKQKQITLHKEIAKHLQTSAQFHLAAARYNEEDNAEKAVKSNGSAQEHLVLANEAQKENIKQYALIAKPVI